MFPTGYVIIGHLMDKIDILQTFQQSEMEADISILYESGFYRVLNFKCRCTSCVTSKPEYVDTFSISFVRKGNFIFNVFRNSFDSHTGRILLTKPGYEHTVKHTHEIPDECTIIDFTQSFYQQVREHYSTYSFFSNDDVHAQQIAVTAQTEYLHHYLTSKLFNNPNRLEMDQIVLEIVEATVNFLTTANIPPLSMRMKKNHLSTVEQSKAFMVQNLSQDLSLSSIAESCHISLFHFSRIFKKFTGESPYAFLLGLRLKKAEVLLKFTNNPISDIAFHSGFNSLEHFSATFHKHFGHSPLAYRTQL